MIPSGDDGHSSCSRRVFALPAMAGLLGGGDCTSCSGTGRATAMGCDNDGIRIRRLVCLPAVALGDDCRRRPTGHPSAHSRGRDTAARGTTKHQAHRLRGLVGTGTGSAAREPRMKRGRQADKQSRCRCGLAPTSPSQGPTSTRGYSLAPPRLPVDWPPCRDAMPDARMRTRARMWSQCGTTPSLGPAPPHQPAARCERPANHLNAVRLDRTERWQGGTPEGGPAPACP